MRRVTWLLVTAWCCTVVADEGPADELEQARKLAAETRLAAAADPTIANADSPPVQAYVAEQRRRSIERVAGLRRRLSEYESDPSKQSLVPILRQQLAELENKPAEQVSFDAAYDYQPTTGLVGYSKNVRLLENTSDGEPVVQVESIALRLGGLDTAAYPSGKFLSVPQAILVGPEIPDQTVQGVQRTVYAATLVELDALLQTGRSSAKAKSASSDRKMNVLFIVIDDLNCDLNSYGVPSVISPNIDRLAARGVRFDRAYCQYAVCAPSRWSFLSGLRPETTGIFDFQTLLRDKMRDVVFLPQLFRQNGYLTTGNGKVFHDERQSDREISWDVYHDRMGADEQEAAAVQERYRHKEGQRPFTPWTQLSGPEEKTRDGATARRIAEIMTTCARDEEPFFVAAGFHKPHLPWTAPTKYFDLYRDRSIPEPRDPPLVDVPAIALMTELVGNPPPPRLEAISTYYTCISFIDAQVGLLLDTLDREKLWDHTVVVLFSDHGYHLGDHDGLWAKFTVFDQGCRVPLVIAAPGCARGAVSPRTVELIDIYPTVAELCSLAPPSTLDGRSLKPLLVRPDAAWEHPARSLVHHEGSVGKTVCTERWRYTEWDGGKRGAELYDHTVDPGEYRNLAGDARYATIVAEMKPLLLP